LCSLGIGTIAAARRMRGCAKASNRAEGMPGTMSVADFVGLHRFHRQAIRMATPEAATLVGTRTAIRPGVRRGEIVRKAIHMTPGALPFAMFLYPHPRVLPWDSLLILTVLTAILTGVYIASKRIVRRPDETDFYSTCLSYPACILAMLLAFPQYPEFTCVVVVVLGLGDAAAYIGGHLFGGRRLPWNPKKTWAGTISFILVAAPVATLAYYLEANAPALAYWGAGGPATVSLKLAALCATVATITAAVAESWKTSLTDNLRVGVAASVAVVAAHYLAAGWFLT
jgi:dolichol kinase